MSKQTIKKQGLLLAFGFVAVGVIIATVPDTMSFMTSMDTVLNPIELDTVEIQVEEEFKPPITWDGSEHPKEVVIQNNGGRRTLIRVALIPRWENSDGTPFAGDVSRVTLTLNPDNQNTSPGWRLGSDGYYYYTAFVNTGASTLELLSNVTFDTDGLEDTQINQYKNKKLIVDVKSEAVHANLSAYQAVWPGLAAADEAIDEMLRALIDTN